MTEVQRLYKKYETTGKNLVTGRKYQLGKWYSGYKYVVMTENVPILACKQDGTMEIIRPEGAKVQKQLNNV